jgi:hypothetical protein
MRRLRLRLKASAWSPVSVPPYKHIRTFLIVMPRPVRRRGDFAAVEEHSADLKSLGAASGVDPLLTCSYVYRGAQADAQTVFCGEATLPKQEKNNFQKE